MRAGRLPEILCNENIIVVGASGSVAHTKEFRSTWKLIEFAHKFPFTEVVKISPLKKNSLMVYVYDATAKALAEKRYEDVLEYADTLETHSFSDDIEYIESYRKLYETDNIECSSENDNFNKDEYLKHLSEDVFAVKIRERSTGRIIELNPNIDNSFSDTMTRNLFHSGEYILISGNLPDKWK